MRRKLVVLTAVIACAVPLLAPATGEAQPRPNPGPTAY